MEKETSDLVSLGIVLIAAAVVTVFGLFIFTAAARYRAMSQEVISISNINIESLIAALSLKAAGLSLILAGVTCGIIAMCKSKFAIEDVVKTYNNKLEYIEKSMLTGERIVGLPEYFHDGDICVVKTGSPKISLIEYLFKCKDHFLDVTGTVVSKGRYYNLDDTVEMTGNFYKIGNYLVYREAMYFKVGSEVKSTIYALDKDVYKVGDNYVIMKIDR